MVGNIVQDTLYIIGGTANNDTLETQNLGYDLVNKTWSIKAKSPVLTMSGSSVVYKDEIYVLFGHDLDSETRNDADTLIWIYNPSKDEWREGPSIPIGNRIHGSATILNGVIYLIGGSGSTATEKDAWAYDIEKDEWNKLPDLPTVMGVWMGNAVTIGKSIYYSCSGTYVDSAFCKVFKYTPGKKGVSTEEISFSEHVTIADNQVNLSPNVASVQVFNYEGKLLGIHHSQFSLNSGVYFIQVELESREMLSSKVVIKCFLLSWY